MLTDKMMEQLRKQSLRYAKKLHKENPCIKDKNNCVSFEWDCCEFYSCPNSPANKNK